ncbi:MAG TPA: RNA methyltransferase [Candidatus Babeliales bacterium]|nr:RNA methyltransferase [Candidatus Babeliales bacterium]
MIRKINSHANPIIKHVVQLHSSKHRSKLQEFIAEGFRTIATILKANNELLTLFTIEEYLYDAQQLTDDKHIIIVDESVMKKISSSQSPSGLLATFRIPPQPSFDTIESGIVLAQITDPGNMGTLIRTAAAMNKKTVICIETVDPWNQKVVQATAGAIGVVSIFCISWHDLLLNKKNIPLCALLPTDGKSPNTVNLRDALIIIGNESHGIPSEWVAQCDEQITLPMPGKFESLNAAVAGSIALYLAATH